MGSINRSDYGGRRVRGNRRFVIRSGSRIGVGNVPMVGWVNAEELLEKQLRIAGMQNWVREYRFHAIRKWRFDFANVALKIAVEIEGFAPGGRAGRHQRVAGFTADTEKYAEAAIAGWRLIRVTTRQVRDGTAFTWIERAVAA